MCPNGQQFLYRVATFCSFVLLLGVGTYGQLQGGTSLNVGQIPVSGRGRALTLLVSVREISGLPLDTPAKVYLSNALGGQNVLAVTQDTATASFANVQGGDYLVDVEAAGYRSAHERATVMGVSTYTVYVYLTPESSIEPQKSTSSRPVMSPKLQKEMDRSLNAIREKKYVEARQHLAAAAKLAPSNPDIQYLLAMVDYAEHNLEPAREHLEKAIGMAPTHERSLVLLGQVFLETKDYQKATKSLETAVLNNSKNAQAHLLLAVSYFNQGQFGKARTEAKAAAADKNRAATGRLIEAKTYVMERDLSGARGAFEAYLKEFPRDKGAEEAREFLDRAALRDGATEKAETKPVVVDPAHGTDLAEHPWAPPDTDDKIPSVAPGVSCTTTEIVNGASERSQRALESLERFGATELIDHQEIDKYGNPGPVRSHAFNYIILVQRPKNGVYIVDERRDGGESLDAFPTSLATRGLVSLGVYLFHPSFTEDFDYRCEGLGRWGGHPAWQLRFEQKGSTASRVRTWSYQGRNYSVALKGRVWLSPNTFDILHLETDLRDPVKELQLNREHLSIEYGPVSFKQVKEELWLPQTAEMYFSFLGRRYHHSHTLSDYLLFDVDSHSKTSAPRAPDPPHNEQ